MGDLSNPPAAAAPPAAAQLVARVCRRAADPPPGHIVEMVQGGHHGARGARLAGAQRHFAVGECRSPWDAAHHPPHRAKEGVIAGRSRRRAVPRRSRAGRRQDVEKGAGEPAQLDQLQRLELEGGEGGVGADETHRQEVAQAALGKAAAARAEEERDQHAAAQVDEERAPGPAGAQLLREGGGDEEPRHGAERPTHGHEQNGHRRTVAKRPRPGPLVGSGPRRIRPCGLRHCTTFSAVSSMKKLVCSEASSVPWNWI